MNRLDFYLLKNLAVTFFYSTVAMTSIVWITQATRLIDLIINAGAPFGTFMSMMFLTIPTFLAIIMPIALAGAVLFTYNKLTVDSELTVMRAVGQGPWNLARPAIVLGLAVVCANFLLNVYGRPAANSELARLQEEVQSGYGSILIREGAFNQVSDGLTLFVGTRESTGELGGLLIRDQRTAGTEVTVIAKRGIMTNTATGIRLVVEDGVRQELAAATGQYSELFFDRYVIELQLFDEKGTTRMIGPQERSTADLISLPPDVVRDSPLGRHYSAELHMRLSTPFLALAYVFIGLAALLPGEYRRRGQAVQLAIACLGILILQGFSFVLPGLIRQRELFVPLAYIVYLVPILPAFWLLSRK